MNKFIVCPANCLPSTLPVLDVSQCTTADGVLRSEITDILFLSKRDATGAVNPIPTGVSLSTLGALIDNTDLTGTKVKHLVVSGAMGKPTDNTVQVEKFKILVKDRTYTITADVLSMTDKRFEFMRTLMCGAFEGYIWFATEDHIFGGHTSNEEVVTVQSVTAAPIFDKGIAAYQKGELVLTWKSISFPDRSPNWGL